MVAPTPEQLAFLTNPPPLALGRIATVDSKGMPHVVPAGWSWDAAAGELVLGGRDVLRTRRARHVRTTGVAAVTIDQVLLGYSAQGPGTLDLAQKPDLCVPSHFAGATRLDRVNTGTSTACALATGAIAALRSKRSIEAITPQDMRALLCRTARLPESAAGPWNRDFGHGVLDAAAALGHYP